MVIDQLLDERERRYGAFDEHARITVSMKLTARTGRSWDRMTCSQQEAIDMILHKIGRIVNGDPDYQDSWTDVIGYARLIEAGLDAGPV